MLGRRDPQRSLFEAQAWPHRVPEDSFYARMGAVNDVLFKEMTWPSCIATIMDGAACPRR
jgi:hypothetical protein